MINIFMGRPKIYHTEEARKEAYRLKRIEYYKDPEKLKKNYEANQKTQSERWRRWRLKHLKEHNAKSALEKAMRLQRIPPWADLEAIKQFYLNRPEGYHVDHIVPLRGKTVSGLHVLENLQYLPAKENMSKGNKFS
jgi:hypothetical protein